MVEVTQEDHGGAADVEEAIWNESEDIAVIIARHREAAEAASKAREAALVEALWLFREFVLCNATQWQTGANHHHPIYPMIAELIGEMGGIISSEHWRFIQPENRAALAETQP